MNIRTYLFWDVVVPAYVNICLPFDGINKRACTLIGGVLYCGEIMIETTLTIRILQYKFVLVPTKGKFYINVDIKLLATKNLFCIIPVPLTSTNTIKVEIHCVIKTPKIHK